MGKKDYGLGERIIPAGSTDPLLESKVNDMRRRKIEREEEVAEAAHNARMAELDKKTKTATAEVEKAENKSDNSGFKITGGVNLGNIDLQAERDKANQDLERMRNEADEAAQRLGQENQQLREEIHNQQIKVLEIGLQSQIQKLTEIVQSNSVNKKSFAQEYAEAAEIAAQLGYIRPGPETSDLNTQLALRKMEHENKLELRRIDRENKESDRKWELEIRKLDDDRARAKQDAEREDKKLQMFSQAPIVLGQAIGQAIMDSGAGTGGGNKVQSEAPESPQKKSGPALQAGVGQSGEVECPECGEPIAVGPTARTAACANCGLSLPVRRIKEVVEEEEQ